MGIHVHFILHMNVLMSWDFTCMNQDLVAVYASMTMDSTPVNVLAMYKFLTEQMFGKRDVPGLPKYLKNSDNISPLVCTKPTCKWEIEQSHGSSRCFCWQYASMYGLSYGTDLFSLLYWQLPDLVVSDHWFMDPRSCPSYIYILIDGFFVTVCFHMAQIHLV